MSPLIMNAGVRTNVSRGRGYGKELLRLLLLEAGKAVLEKVLITVHKDNIASRAVACANGGILTGETDERAYYWLSTHAEPADG